MDGAPFPSQKVITVPLDLGMLANDLATVLFDDHGIDVDSDDVARGLGAFLSTITGDLKYLPAQAEPAKPRCCIGPFADGSHAINCTQKCQDCGLDASGPYRCQCNGPDPVDAALRLAAFVRQHDLLHEGDVSGDRITAIAHTEFAPLNASDIHAVLGSLAAAIKNAVRRKEGKA